MELFLGLETSEQRSHPKTGVDIFEQMHSKADDGARMQEDYLMVLYL